MRTTSLSLHRRPRRRHHPSPTSSCPLTTSSMQTPSNLSRRSLLLLFALFNRFGGNFSTSSVKRSAGNWPSSSPIPRLLSLSNPLSTRSPSHRMLSYKTQHKSASITSSLPDLLPEHLSPSTLAPVINHITTHTREWECMLFLCDNAAVAHRMRLISLPLPSLSSYLPHHHPGKESEEGM